MAYHNWRRPLPRPIVIPRIMTLETARGRASARASAFAGASTVVKQTWQRVASIATAAARGQLPADDVAVAPKMVLSMEGISCR